MWTSVCLLCSVPVRVQFHYADDAVLYLSTDTQMSVKNYSYLSCCVLLCEFHSCRPALYLLHQSATAQEKQADDQKKLQTVSSLFRLSKSLSLRRKKTMHNYKCNCIAHLHFSDSSVLLCGCPCFWTSQSHKQPGPKIFKHQKSFIFRK